MIIEQEVTGLTELERLLDLSSRKTGPSVGAELEGLYPMRIADMRGPDRFVTIVYYRNEPMLWFEGDFS